MLVCASVSDGWQPFVCILAVHDALEICLLPMSVDAVCMHACVVICFYILHMCTRDLHMEMCGCVNDRIPREMEGDEAWCQGAAACVDPVYPPALGLTYSFAL